MNSRLQGRKVAILATDGVEQVELEQPRRALDKAGALTHLVSPKQDSIQAINHDEKGARIPVDRMLSDVRPSDYDALVLPGGVSNPDSLRTDESAVQFVREFMLADKPVAAICHGPWMLVEAGSVRGRTLTSWPSLKTDIVNAGGRWVDEVVHVDDTLITSRNPGDLPQFCATIVREFALRIHASRPPAESGQGVAESEGQSGRHSFGPGDLPNR